MTQGDVLLKIGQEDVDIHAHMPVNHTQLQAARQSRLKHETRVHAAKSRFATPTRSACALSSW